MDQTLESRYADVKQRVAAAAKAAGRKPSDIVIVAVTKFAEADQIRAEASAMWTATEARRQEIEKQGAELDAVLAKIGERLGMAEPPAKGWRRYAVDNRK